MLTPVCTEMHFFVGMLMFQFIKLSRVLLMLLSKATCNTSKNFDRRGKTLVFLNLIGCRRWHLVPSEVPGVFFFFGLVKLFFSLYIFRPLSSTTGSEKRWRQEAGRSQTGPAQDPEEPSDWNHLHQHWVGCTYTHTLLGRAFFFWSWFSYSATLCFMLWCVRVLTLSQLTSVTMRTRVVGRSCWVSCNLCWI